MPLNTDVIKIKTDKDSPEELMKTTKEKTSGQLVCRPKFEPGASK
jgi:hypothetical protein